MDAGYLRDTLGQVVAKGCAETIAVAPVDPVHYLSLWLLKHVENAKLADELRNEKELLFQLHIAKQDKQRQEESSKQERIQKQNDKINFLRSFHNDPYLLFDECLKAILEFTGGTSAYVALVLDKPWEPPKKVPESVDGEDVPNNENAQEEEEEEEEEEASGESNPKIAGQGSEGEDPGNEGDERKEGGEEASESSGGETKKIIKPPKPPNYKKKVLLYVAATPNNEFLLNKKLDRKTGPISFSVLLQGLPKLHIPNVLYKEGVHFFQGLPLMGGYLTTPVSLKETLSQVVALLCVDTLRKDHVGTGRPFTSDEQEFITAVAQAATEALSTFLTAVSGNFSTKIIIKELQEQLQEVEDSHKAKSKGEQKKSLQNDGTEGEPNPEGEPEEGKDEGKEPIQLDETNSNGGEDAKNGDKDPDANEQDDVEDNAEEDEIEEEEEEAEEDEGQEEAEQHDDVDDSHRQMQEMSKYLKQQQKKVAKLQKQFQKCQTRLEKQAAKVIKLEKQLTRSSGMLDHLCKLLTTVLDLIIKHKDEVFGQVKKCLFPAASVHRVLKALLHVLGQSDTVVHDWTKSRQVLDEKICMVMKEYSSRSEMDLKKWDLSDIFLDGLTEMQLSEEAPIGYLAQQWLVAAKKVAFETMKCKDYKTKNENAAKDFADAELEQMVAEIDLRVAIDEEKKLALQLEDLQANFAKELSSNPTSEVQEQNVEEEDEEE
ncbi:hypothetical protein GOP47_0001673 [Adiantum capillus-veneris]|uniref:Uncharacterized protein n=1 Tax=Adiantum capillus-veneris TaxID=13818 RepID=A0A9D4V8P8_ADICA|nr:hypothetical protein GOP47_0001673 [Adiantum capillus-veneris]